MATWNPYHGCRKLSEGCLNCYVYRIDKKHGKDSSKVIKTSNFDLPLKRGKDGEYKIKSGETVYTCFTSDFFLEEADKWRIELYEIMKVRKDLDFFIITKRIDRFYNNLPADWFDGYSNVKICCTVENQKMVDYRLPIYKELPIKHKAIICSPLLESLEIERYLGEDIEEVVVGGESGEKARVCDYDWVLGIRHQCIKKHVPFQFMQTGANFRQNGIIYKVKRRFQHEQARKAGINYIK